MIWQEAYPGGPMVQVPRSRAAQVAQTGARIGIQAGAAGIRQQRVNDVKAHEALQDYNRLSDYKKGSNASLDAYFKGAGLDDLPDKAAADKTHYDVRIGSNGELVRVPTSGASGVATPVTTPEGNPVTPPAKPAPGSETPARTQQRQRNLKAAQDELDSLTQQETAAATAKQAQDKEVGRLQSIQSYPYHQDKNGKFTNKYTPDELAQVGKDLKTAQAEQERRQKAWEAFGPRKMAAQAKITQNQDLPSQGQPQGKMTREQFNQAFQSDKRNVRGRAATDADYQNYLNQ